MKKTIICSICKISPKINTSRCRECNKAYYRDYRKKNKEKFSEYFKKHLSNPENKKKRNEYLKDYCQKNTNKRAIYAKKWLQNLRFMVISHYGGKCKCCGEEQIEFLAIDHINEGGRKHRKSISGNIYLWIKDNNYPDDLQVLCHNCNSAKSYYGRCPHMRNIMPTELCKVPIEEKK